MIKNCKYIIVLFFVCGCSSSRVFYDYDIKTDFSKYSSYHYFEDVGDGLNELDVKRFTRSIDHLLDSAQIKKVEKPSFFINVISEKSQNNQDDFGIGVGGGGRNLGVGFSTAISIGGKKINERVTIDFVDASTNTLFWQGVLNVKVREKMTPQQRVKLVDQIVRKILSNYPPKS